MKPVVLVGIIFIAFSLSLLRAGSIYVIGSSSATTGTLTLNATAIHAEGVSPSDVDLTTVLEADFTDTPFQLSYFSSVADPNRLPANWAGTDIGHPGIPGSLTYVNGDLTLTGAGVDLQRSENADQVFVCGQTVTGDTQLTVRIKEIDGDRTQVGPMLRETLDPLSKMFSMGMSTIGGGLYVSRGRTGDHVGWVGFNSDEPPIWIRLTRSGNSIDIEVSGDGTKWEFLAQHGTDLPANAWLGFFLDSYSEKVAGKAILDQITLSPVPAEPNTLPPGVLLRSGTFLSGSFHTTDAKGGTFDRHGKSVALTNDQIAAVINHPVTQKQIAEASAQAGLMMKNGDFLTGDIQRIDGGYAIVNSLLLGIASYEGDKWRAGVFAPVQPQPSDYEVRLKDGSIIRATGFNPGGGVVSIQEVSGVSIDASLDEVAQVRAGTAHVQPMIDLPWKATAPLAATAPAPAPTPAAPTAASVDASLTNAPAATDTNAPPAAAPAPPAPPADPNSTVLRWQGPNQEQILAVPSGTSLAFPLTGKFSGMALRIAVSPDAPPNALVVVRFLADGRELGRTPPIKASDQPAFANLNFQSAKTITIVADSSFPGVKALLIDPVAIR
jgi:hypothetical protein